MNHRVGLFPTMECCSALKGNASTAFHMDEACSEARHSWQGLLSPRWALSRHLHRDESVLVSGAGVGELVEVGFLWQMMKFGLVSGDSHMIT